MYIWLALVIFVITLWCLKTSEGYFGFSGYKKPVEVNINEGVFDETGFVLSDRKVTPDEVNMCMVPAVKFISQQTGLCMKPVETNNFQIFNNPKTNQSLYKLKVMFVVTGDRFPYMVGVNFGVVNGKIVSASTQQMGGAGGFIPSGETESYMPYESVVEDAQKVILSRK